MKKMIETNTYLILTFSVIHAILFYLLPFGLILVFLSGDWIEDNASFDHYNNLNNYF